MFTGGGGERDLPISCGRRILGDLGQFTPRREAYGEVFAIKRSTQQMPLQGEVLADRPEAHSDFPRELRADPPTPLAAILTGANVNDVTQLLPLIDAIPPIRGLRGHPLRRPRVVYADRGYDSERHRRALRDRGIEPVIAKRRTEHGSGLGKYRRVVERTHAGFITSVASVFVSSAVLIFTARSSNSASA